MLLVWAHEGLHEHCTMCNTCYSKLSKPFELISKTWDFFSASYVIQCKEQNLQILLRDVTYITIIIVTNSELALRIKQAEICR